MRTLARFPVPRLSQSSLDSISLAAGLAVASRLGAGNTSSNVLVLEAGSDGQGHPRIDVPGFAGASDECMYRSQGAITLTRRA